MIVNNTLVVDFTEDLLAELTDAAYRAALRNGLAGSFLDAQLGIWADLRQVLSHHGHAAPARQPAPVRAGVQNRRAAFAEAV